MEKFEIWYNYKRNYIWIRRKDKTGITAANARSNERYWHKIYMREPDRASVMIGYGMFWIGE